MKKSERLAVELREFEGLTLSKIGEILGVTKERARQLYILGCRLRQQERAWTAGLSSRALDAIERAGIRNRVELEEKWPELQNLRNFGRITEYHIREWLEKKT